MPTRLEDVLETGCEAAKRCSATRVRDSQRNMTTLKHVHLMTLNLQVAFDKMTRIGATPAGLRRIAPVTGGRFEGPHLKGTVIEGSDWVVNRADGVMLVDVRLSLRTDDGAAIYLSYGGRFLASEDVMARFGRGAQLDPSEYSLAVTARLECGDERYRWLNDVIAVGTGSQLATGVVYELFAVG
jgi:hypothetical protein